MKVVMAPGPGQNRPRGAQIDPLAPLGTAGWVVGRVSGHLAQHNAMWLFQALWGSATTLSAELNYKKFASGRLKPSFQDPQRTLQVGFTSVWPNQTILV